jgi:TIR domain/SIR2-like domain
MPQSNVITAEPDAGFNDLFWEGLLLHIEERRVIPVVGQDLLTVDVDGSVLPLYRWAAERLAQALRLPGEDLPAEFTLNDVICHHLHARGDLGDVYIGLAAIMREASFAPPEALRQLAAITDFDLYVSTTFDSLLVEALKKERRGVTPDVVAYSTGKVPDLATPKDKLSRPVVYHLFGKVAPTASYAVSDEDMLEFVCKLQAPNYSPEKLFAELENNHLLMLGCGFDDWLERFFLRTAKRRKLSDRREVREVVADHRTRTDPALVLFLEHFSSGTRVFQGGGAAEFVAELWRRWSARQPEHADADAPQVSGRFLPPEAEMPEGAVFISYTRKDLDAVKRLKAALDAADVKVWFDMSDLDPGDNFSRVIQENIRRCNLFLPIISSNTEARREAFFYREWRWAIEREEAMAGDAKFLLPVVIDDTKEPGVRVPKRFAAINWTRLPDGNATTAFVAIVRELVSAG